jgi:hypothetical protein
MDYPNCSDDPSAQIDDPGTVADDYPKGPSTQKADNSGGLDDMDDMGDKKHTFSGSDEYDFFSLHEVEL